MRKKLIRPWTLKVPGIITQNSLPHHNVESRLDLMKSSKPFVFSFLSLTPFGSPFLFSRAMMDFTSMCQKSGECDAHEA